MERAEIYITDARGTQCTYLGLRSWVRKTQLPKYDIPPPPLEADGIHPNPPTHETARVQAFLEELTELSRRTGLVVCGCACHDSPALLVHEEEFSRWDASGGYLVDYKRDLAELRWRPRADGDQCIAQEPAHDETPVKE